MRKLVLTTLARENLKDVFEFIESEFGINSRIKFANKVNKSLNLIVINNFNGIIDISNFNLILAKEESLVYICSNCQTPRDLGAWAQ